MIADENLEVLCYIIWGSKLAYASDRIPEIAEDIVNIGPDKRIKMGFCLSNGPFGKC